MAKRFPASRIKGHRIYTIWEVSEVLGCHKKTVAEWIKSGQLEADRRKRPWLIDGRDLKAFLGQRATRARCKLALHHCYCLGCKSPQEPDGKMADYTQQTTDTGQLTGLCPACGALMHKVIRRADLEAIQAKLEVTVQQASPRLVSLAEPRSNVTFERERQTHGKAQQR